MTVSRIVACTVLTAVLAACSSHPAAQADGPATASTAMPASNPLTPLLNTRQRAQAVEQDLKAHDQAERKALKDAQQ